MAGMVELVERLATALGGRYRIDRELGRGGMATVLLADDLRHGRKVALKVLRPEIAHPANAHRFLREIRIAAQLQHPNILPLIDSGEAEGLTYFVMPYVPGESLRNRLDREKQLPLADALQIARETADALSYAHEHGVIHRDIKPENILLGSGHALVTDFGIARAISEVAGNNLTETGIAVGTPTYMSPEQASGTGEFDHRTDVYSLGCVLYEMLTGSPPYTGMNAMAVMARKAVEPVPGLRVVRDTVPPLVEQVVIKALARVPADRFATARQFADALAGDQHALGPPQRREDGSSRKRWLLAGALTAVVLIGSIYALVAGMPWRGQFAPANAEFAQLTAQPGVEWFPSLSPDGKWLLYSGESSGNRDIYLQSVGGQLPINLTKDSPAHDDQPAFSPDGERIAFRSTREGGGIFVMGRTGEGLRRVTNRGFKPTWSPDGTRLAFTTENVETNPGNSEGVSELWIVNVNGSEQRRLLSGDAVLASWSPHGNRIAYTRRLGPTTQERGGIWTIAVAEGVPGRVTTDRSRDWNPTWSRDGRYLYFSSERSGSMNLWRVPIDERSGRTRGKPEPVTTPATFLAHPTLSADGRQIAYTSALVSINIQRLSLDPRAGKVIGDPSWVTTGSRRWSSPDPSPDGQWVAFYSLTQPEGHIYIARPDGSEARQVTGDSGVVDRVPRWSPDGNWIAYFSNRAGPLQLWKIRSDGSELQRLSPGTAAYATWSPDGARAAIPAGPNLGDTVQILDATRTFEHQRPVVLPPSAVGPFLPNSWSADGERLTGQIGTAGVGIAVYSLRSQTYERLTDFGEWPVWLPDGRRILFVAGGKAFHIVDSHTKQVQKIFSVTRDVIGPPRLTRDGRTAYFSRRVTEADVWLLTMR
jgi:eukaryotic-like serine/threonine-protein kinase